MSKLFKIFLVVLAIPTLILGYNFIFKCSEYGGFMGIIKKCDCYGLEINHPLNLLQSQMPGGSATMCLGIQLPKDKKISGFFNNMNLSFNKEVVGVYTIPTSRLTVFYFYINADGTCSLKEGIYNSPEIKNGTWKVSSDILTINFNNDEVIKFKIAENALIGTEYNQDKFGTSFSMTKSK